MPSIFFDNSGDKIDTCLLCEESKQYLNIKIKKSQENNSSCRIFDFKSVLDNKLSGDGLTKEKILKELLRIETAYAEKLRIRTGNQQVQPMHSLSVPLLILYAILVCVGAPFIPVITAIALILPVTLAIIVGMYLKFKDTNEPDQNENSLLLPLALLSVLVCVGAPFLPAVAAIVLMLAITVVIIVGTFLMCKDIKAELAQHLIYSKTNANIKELTDKLAQFSDPAHSANLHHNDSQRQEIHHTSVQNNEPEESVSTTNQLVLNDLADRLKAALLWREVELKKEQGTSVTYNDYSNYLNSSNQVDSGANTNQVNNNELQFLYNDFVKNAQNPNEVTPAFVASLLKKQETLETAQQSTSIFFKPSSSRLQTDGSYPSPLAGPSSLMC